MEAGGWKTKNWSDFTCYTSDKKAAFTMEPVTDETWRWSIFGAGAKGSWILTIHNVQQNVFLLKKDGVVFGGDIITRELQGDTLICRGEIKDSEIKIAECEATIRRIEVEGREVFNIKYSYQICENGPYQVLQQYEMPAGTAFAAEILLPTEGCRLSWEERGSSMAATVVLDQLVDKKAVFEVGILVREVG
jgi:hypothetical protein